MSDGYLNDIYCEGYNSKTGLCPYIWFVEQLAFFKGYHDAKRKFGTGTALVVI